MLIYQRFFGGLYRTYEELKQKQVSPTFYVLLEFVSYLWGIETDVSHKITFQLFLVCIVPMRNWNKKYDIWSITTLKGLYRTYEELKRQRFVLGFRNWRSSLYRTYEELKLPHANIQCKHYFSLYRTYEELKLGERQDSYVVEKGLYRTYEELKLTNQKAHEEKYKVCIVPMRNWNCRA